MGAAARRHAAEFTWEQTGRRFAAVLDEVTGVTVADEPDQIDRAADKAQVRAVDTVWQLEATDGTPA
jgi:hypothetical protein